MYVQVALGQGPPNSLAPEQGAEAVRGVVQRLAAASAGSAGGAHHGAHDRMAAWHGCG